MFRSSARQRILSGSIKSWARCWIVDAHWCHDHLILDCFEDIPKDFAGESHHFSLDQIFNDLDRCFFVWWNLKIGTFIFLVVVRSSEGANLPKPDIVWYLCLRVWLIIMYSTTLYKYIYLYSRRLVRVRVSFVVLQLVVSRLKRWRSYIICYSRWCL